MIPFPGLPASPNGDSFAELKEKEETRRKKRETLMDLSLISVTQPGQVGLTSVGFAAPARAGCAFIA